MNLAYLFALFLAVLTIGIMGQKYSDKQLRLFPKDEYAEIKKYLLRDNDLEKSKKTILWIHVPYEYNSRRWLDFGSRSSFDLNQNYLYLTVRTIVKCCDETFKIVIIDDASFAHLLPNWSVNMEMIGDPIKQYMRQLAMAKLIYAYGGMTVPISFLCFRDLAGLFRKGTNDNAMFVCENYDANITSTNRMFYPNAHFMGATKENETVRQYIHFMEQHLSRDFTAQTQFQGDLNKWCEDKITKGRMRLIPGTDVGTRTMDDEPVTVDMLLSDNYIHFYAQMYGIWIPSDDILKRVHYEWFARLDYEELLKSQCILAKYFVLASSTDEQIVEPIQNRQSNVKVGANANQKQLKDNPPPEKGWIDFYRVPLMNGTSGLFGPMPMGIGNRVPHAIN